MKKAVKGHLQLYRLLTGIADPPDMMYYRALLWELMAMETLTFMKNIEFVVKINEYHSCLYPDKLNYPVRRNDVNKDKQQARTMLNEYISRMKILTKPRSKKN